MTFISTLKRKEGDFGRSEELTTRASGAIEARSMPSCRPEAAVAPS